MVRCEQGLCLALWQLPNSCRNLCSLLLNGEQRNICIYMCVFFLALAEMKNAGLKKLLRSLSKQSAISLWSANGVKMVLGHSLCRDFCNFLWLAAFEALSLIFIFQHASHRLCLCFLPDFMVSSLLACQILFLPEAGAAPACQQPSDGFALVVSPVLWSAFSKTDGFRLRFQQSLFKTFHFVLPCSAYFYS